MSHRTQIAIILLLVTAATGVWIFLSNSTFSTDSTVIDVSSFQPPRDVVIDFYDEWSALVSTSSTQVPEMALVTTELRERLEQSLATESSIDPVFCSEELPERFGTKVVYTTNTNAEVIVSSRGLETPRQALVLLSVTPEGWIISNITCSNGEEGPELEFTFEQTGNLLKDSLQEPLDNSRWHLVYTRDGVDGNIIPLYFDQGSVCGGSVCSTDSFSEPQEVTIKGQMTEAGVAVERLEL